ncbi:MAG TPA: DNA starvation/stationary phase protection protein [Methylocystis sp.]|nr:DNA starvation/stationary phase protection protein [Methylocystis sp.]
MPQPKTPKGPDTNRAALDTPSDLSKEATRKVAAEINKLIADAFTLYVKTKNFHWHLSGPHFRDYHLLLDEQASQIYATIDPLAERVRKLGEPTLRSIGHISKLARLADNDADFVSAFDMLYELLEDNKNVAAAMRKAHEICDDNHDNATASLLEVFIDETEKRTWFLFEAARAADPSGH